MTFLGRLALLFVLVPIIELVLLIQIGQAVGLLPTLLLVVATGVGGAALARLEGLRTLVAFQRELGQGRLPGRALMDGASILVGGAFLLTPGILTDLAGLTLLLPITRRWIQRRVARRLERSIRDGGIRMVMTGPGGWRGSPEGFGAPGPGRERRPDVHGERPLDPSKGIDIDSPDA